VKSKRRKSSNFNKKSNVNSDDYNLTVSNKFALLSPEDEEAEEQDVLVSDLPPDESFVPELPRDLLEQDVLVSNLPPDEPDESSFPQLPEELWEVILQMRSQLIRKQKRQVYDINTEINNVNDLIALGKRLLDQKTDLQAQLDYYKSGHPTHAKALQEGIKKIDVELYEIVLKINDINIDERISSLNL